MGLNKMMVDDIKQMKNVVEYILIEHPRTRNSDTLLIFKVLSYLGFAKKNERWLSYRIS